MNKYILYALFSILFGCSAFNRQTYIPSEKAKIASEIRKKAATELMLQAGLQPCGSGGQMMDKVKMLALSFDYKEPLQIGEARILLAKAVDVFLDKINSDDRIRPYLHNYPFEPKNVEIRIFLRGRDRFDVPSGELSVISAIDGVFRYKIDNPKDKSFITIFNESYEEAKQTLKEKWTGYTESDSRIGFWASSKRQKSNITKGGSINCNTTPLYDVRFLTVFNLAENRFLNHFRYMTLCHKRAQPDATGIDHDFRSPTFEKPLTNHIRNHHLKNGEYE